MKFYLQRKSGYLSSNSLAMIYPMYVTGVYCQGDAAAPIKVKIRGRVFGVKPWLVRFPSWVARKARNTDIGGFRKSPHHAPYVMIWNRPGNNPRKQGWAK